MRVLPVYNSALYCSQIVPVCLFAPLTSSSMSTSALRGGFCPHLIVCTRTIQQTIHLHLSVAVCTVRLLRAFLCCNLPEHGMSTCAATNITCFRALSDFQPKCSRSNSVLMVVVLDIILSDNGSVRALSYNDSYY